MANNNNVYFNAALAGFIAGAMQSRKPTSTTAADYAQLANAAAAFAGELDSLIPADALVTTGGAATMLVDTGSNVIQSDTQVRPALLQAIVTAYWSQAYAVSTTLADYAAAAGVIAAIWTQTKAKLVSP